MPSSILSVKAEELNKIENRGNYTVCIVGCGHTSVIQACLFANAGFRVICVDADQTKVNTLARGTFPFLQHETEVELKKHVKAGRLSATSEVETTVAKSDVVVIAIPAKIGKNKKADYTSIKKTCKQIGSSLKQGSLVVVTSPVGIGIIEGLVKETLENMSGFKASTDFGIVYSPILNSYEKTSDIIVNCERFVAALDERSMDSASNVLGTIVKGNIKKICNVKLAEAAVLLGAALHDVNIVLASEFALLCEKTGLDYGEIQKLTKISVQNLFSLLAISNGQTEKESYLLLEDAENASLKLKMLTTAKKADKEMIRHAISLTRDALRNCGKTLKRAKISLFGFSSTPNLKSIPKKTVKEFAQALKAKGARVSLYDPYFSSSELARMQQSFSRSLTEAVEGVDCIVITTGHDQFRRLNLDRLKVSMKTPAAIIDLEGIVDIGKVEKEGFIYRGLGRGIWTK